MQAEKTLPAVAREPASALLVSKTHLSMSLYQPCFKCGTVLATVLSYAVLNRGDVRPIVPGHRLAYTTS